MEVKKGSKRNRPSLREEHKLVTRARIRKAARICFYRADVRTVSLEDIAVEAGIGRATLYLYYPSKNALLVELIAQSLRATDHIYAQLLQLPTLTFENVRAWLAKYLSDVEKHNGILGLFNGEIVLADEVRILLSEHRARTIAMLGTRYPAFDLDSMPLDARPRREVEADFAIMLIEQFCGAASRPDFELDKNAAIDFVAERLFVMLDERTDTRVARDAW
jgi:AcrR family transcriptional regulator